MDNITHVDKGIIASKYDKLNNGRKREEDYSSGYGGVYTTDDSVESMTPNGIRFDAVAQGRLKETQVASSAAVWGIFGSEPVGKQVVSYPNNVTAETLTDSTLGTISNTLNASTGTYNSGIINNNFASLVDELNKLRTDVLALKNKIDSIIQANKKYGLN